MFDKYYYLDVQAKLSNSHINSPSSGQSIVEITGQMKLQAVQKWTTDEPIPTDGSGENFSGMIFSLDWQTEGNTPFLACLGSGRQHPLCDIEKQHWDQLLCSFRFSG